MKKLSLVVLLSLFSLYASAQEKGSISKFQFGMKVSPGINWLKSETKATESDGVLLRASYGFIVNYKLTNNYFLSTGIEIGRAHV